MNYIDNSSSDRGLIKSSPLNGDGSYDNNKQIDLIVDAKEAVTSRLKDPDSADFRNVFYHHSKTSKGLKHMICGEVNSKNGFGGYTGYQFFISGGNATFTFFDDTSADFSNAWQIFCVN